MSREQAEKLYSVHKDQHFFDGLCSFMCGGESMAIHFLRENAIDEARKLLGDPSKAPGTIRGDFQTSTRANVIHASDSWQSYLHEKKVFFI